MSWFKYLLRIHCVCSNHNEKYCSGYFSMKQSFKMFSWLIYRSFILQGQCMATRFVPWKGKVLDVLNIMLKPIRCAHLSNALLDHKTELKQGEMAHNFIREVISLQCCADEEKLIMHKEAALFAYHNRLQHPLNSLVKQASQVSYCSISTAVKRLLCKGVHCQAVQIQQSSSSAFSSSPPKNKKRNCI